MQALVSYAKTIVLFLLFVNLFLQLFGNGNYEKFVRPVCGMLLIILFIRPMLSFFDSEEKLLWSVQQKLSFLYAGEETGITLPKETGYEFAVLQEYEKELTIQLEAYLQKEGLVLDSVDFSVSAEQADFGTIRGISVCVAEKGAVKSEFVSIAPVVFSKEKKEEIATIKEICLRDKLADFYQMEAGNIYVSIKEEQDG